MEPRDKTPLSPHTSERTPYLRQNTEPPEYTPLVSGAAGLLPTSPRRGSEFGGEPLNQGEVTWPAPPPTSATSSCARRRRCAKAPPRARSMSGAPRRRPSERLREASVLPDGEAVRGAARLGRRLGAAARSPQTARGSSGAAANRTPTRPVPARPGARRNRCSLDTVQPGGFGTGKVEPLFQGANPAGTVALFTDTQNLTADANEEGADLYRWRAPGVEGCGEADGCLDDLSAEVANFGEAAEVQGLLAGMGEDATQRLPPRAGSARPDAQPAGR